jgi:hypothetical protein
MDDLPADPSGGIPPTALKGIPQTPQERNYWQFLTTYSRRMPDEAKEYVLKVFSAAVIGQNPKLFGFEFDNPLRKHIEQTARLPGITDEGASG